MLEDEEGEGGCLAAIARKGRSLAHSVENNWNQIILAFLYVAVSTILFASKFARKGRLSLYCKVLEGSV